MNFHTRKWVKPEDLNPNGTLFGGSLLRWIDEEAAIYAIVQLGNQRVVTKYISEINFVSASRQGGSCENPAWVRHEVSSLLFFGLSAKAPYSAAVTGLISAYSMPLRRKISRAKS